MKMETLFRARLTLYVTGLATGALIAGTIAAAQAPASSGTDQIDVCFAHQALDTGGGTMTSTTSGGLTFWRITAPTFHTGSGTDGHGMFVVDHGFANGGCPF